MAEQQPQEQQSRNRPLGVVGIIVVLALVALGVWLSGSEAPVKETIVSTGTVVSNVAKDSDTSSDTPTTGDSAQVSDLPPIAYEDLPPEAHDTIELIDQDGPYPYDKDGSTFQNREGILPDRSEGYYSEYTVITPGSDDRGARRIVAGEDGEMYYTDDHYESFEEVIR